ncbi:MAG: C4-dicarboxylate ABC transporter substrate-binding protein [Alphaproteobacteria bacterium]|nr:C4-dicarboxylate ABC transporter substrate-binding protein [Alphaproteobacteria bacterium]
MTKFSRRQLGGVAAGLAAAAIVRPAAAQAKWKWDLPAGYPATNFHSVNLIQFAKDVKDATAGKLEITVHPGASLFKVPEIMRAVQTNQAQAGELLMVVLENEDAIFGADNVPFLATSFKEAKRLAVAQQPYVDKRLMARGVRQLFSVPWPPQGFYSPKALNVPDDLKGLSFRSYGASAGRFAELAGMRVTTIQAAELVQALAAGRVNSMISSGATGYDSKIWEHIKFFYDVQAWLPKNVTMVNQRSWAALDDATRAAVTKAAEVAEARGWAESERLANFYLEQFKKNGMTVEAPSPALKAGFQRWGEELAKDWLGRAGADGQALIAKYKASA